ncbi:hypothetical protein NQZ68_012563 [Dissostichus eleginoides]|nr:hypothetical protein NQZ68_012563 [Dissostichus eleginoides]
MAGTAYSSVENFQHVNLLFLIGSLVGRATQIDNAVLPPPALTWLSHPSLVLLKQQTASHVSETPCSIATVCWERVTPVSKLIRHSQVWHISRLVEQNSMYSPESSMICSGYLLVLSFAHVSRYLRLWKRIIIHGGRSLPHIRNIG